MSSLPPILPKVDPSPPILPKVDIFFCYAPGDKRNAKRVIDYLSNLQNINIWSDFENNSRENWEEENETHLKSAHLFLFLISPNFISQQSSNRYIKEMKQALYRYTAKETDIIPIMLDNIPSRTNFWANNSLEDLKVLPGNGRPLTSWRKFNDALLHTAEELGDFIDKQILPKIYTKEAQQLLKKGSAESAGKFSEAALAIKSEYLPALYVQAEVLFAQREFRKSLKYSEKIINLNLRTSVDMDQQQLLNWRSKAFHLKAKALSGLHETQQSLATYGQFFTNATIDFLRSNLHSETCEAYLEQIEVLLNSGETDKALQTYDDLIRFDSNNAARHLLRKGEHLEALERYDEALLAFDEAIEKDSHQAEFHHKKGELLLRLRRYHQAIVAYNKSIVLDPQQPLFYQNLGLAHLEAGHYQQALATYKKCLDLEIELDQFDYYRKGRAHFHLNEYGKALLDFDTAIELGGEDINPKFYRYKMLTLNALQQEASKLETQAQVLWKNKETEGFLFINTTQPENFVFLIELQTSSTAVRRVVFNSNIDEIYLASIDSSSYSVKLWNMRTVDKNQKPFYIPQPFSENPSNLITDIAFGTDGKLIVSTSNGDVKFWNLNSVLISIIPHDNRPHKVIYSSNEQYGQLVACAYEHAIGVWKHKDEGWEKLSTFPNLPDDGNVLTIAFSPDGQFLAYGNDRNFVWIFNLLSNDWHPLTGHKGSVESLLFSPNGRLLASGSRDKSIKIWDPHSRQELHTLLPEKNPSPVLCLAYSPDGQVLASGNHDNFIRLWNPDTGQELRTPLTGHTNSVLSVAFSPDGQLLASGSADGTIKIWGKK